MCIENLAFNNKQGDTDDPDDDTDEGFWLSLLRS